MVSPDAASLSVFVRDDTTAHYCLVGEYASPGPVPCATLLGLAWQDVFPEAEGL